MYGIALLLTLAASTQAPPPNEPPPLESGDLTWEVELLDGEMMYGRAPTTDVDRRKGEGEFWIDDPDPAIRNKQLYRFKSCVEESADRRERRWEKSVAAWHAKAGNVQVDLADGSMVWVRKDEADWSGRARKAALDVIEKRETLEAVIAKASTETEANSEDVDQPGFLELWGPQAAVGVLGLVLMGVAARFLVFSGGENWQKIE